MPAVAVPSAVAYVTVTVCALPDDSDTVNTALELPELPSGADALPMDSAGVASSFWIVPVACASAIVAFVAPLRLTTNVSAGSKSTSPVTETVTFVEVAPAVNVAVPDAAT